MTIEFDIIQTCAIMAAGLTVLLSIYFYSTRKEKSGNSLYIIGILGVYTILIVSSLILSSGINRQLFRLAHIGNQSIFLIGPMLYLYIQSHFQPQKVCNAKTAYHLIPFVAATIYLTIKLYYIHLPITCRNNHILLGSLAFVHALGYFYPTVTMIQRKKTEDRNPTAKPEQDTMQWLAYIVFGCFAILLLKMMFFLIWDVSGFYNGCNEAVNLYFLTSFLLVNVFTYMLLRKPEIFQEIKKYKHSVLKTDDKETYKSKLLLLLEHDKIYRNPLVSLNLLAKKLDIPSRYLSQIINETLNKSYYDLINWYRIQDCMQQLADQNNADKTIIEIAYDTGFNSKSAFNTAFTKIAGTTPKAFRKQHQPATLPKMEFSHN